MDNRLPSWDQRLRGVALVIGRIALAYLFFTQLFWKMPPTFGCGPDFAFTSANAEGKLVRTSGLCDWLGVESVWAERPRNFFVANLDNQGPPEIALNLSWAVRLNGWVVNNIIMPNIRVAGWIIFLSEAAIAVTLFFGLFSRLGGLIAIGVSAQLVLGLAGISNPYEWEWGYLQILVLALLMFAFAPGRVFGIDAWLRPRLQAAAANGNALARILSWGT